MRNSEKPSSALSQLCPSQGKGFTALMSPNLCLSIITIILLSTIGWFGYTAVEREMKNNLSSQLQAILSTNVEFLRLWIKDKKLDAEVLASQPEIREKIVSLINTTQTEDISADVLKQSEELKWLRKYLGNACKKYGFVEFVVFDSTGYQVGALLEDALGKRQLIERSDFFYRSLQGDTVVSHPFPGEVDLPDSRGNWQPNRSTMFVSSPIRNDAGDVVGVLAFRFRPDVEFTHMLDISRFGETGESYAFNDEGLLLTESRFIDQLKKMGLILKSDPSSILKIQIRDPGIKFIGGADLLRQKYRTLPLTKMAASAIQGKSGVNVDGYADYRGIPVIGAWTWLPDQYMGITTEIDAEEAFGPLYAVSLGFLSVFGLLTVATFVAILMRLLQMRMQNERDLAQEHAREKEKEVKSLAKFASENPHPVLRIGKDGKLLYANPPAAVLLKNWATQVGDQISAEFQQVFSKALSSKSIQTMETRVETQIFSLQWVPILIEGYVNVYGKNITERKQAQEKLARKAMELKRSNQELEDFAFIASHDLQEPLRKVMLFGDRIKSVYPTNGDDRGKDYIDRLQKSMRKMQNFIHDLLDYSRVARSSSPHKLLNLNEIISEVASDLQTQFDRTQGKITIGPLPSIEGDAFLLTQLFQNLISNALKYSGENVTPKIRISFRPNGNSACDILVEDNGIGIDQKYFHKIFKPFERLHSGDRYDGNGIGLAICAKVSTQHGGGIRIESQPGKGSTFIITLQKAKSAAASGAIKETELAG